MSSGLAYLGRNCPTPGKQHAREFVYDLLSESRYKGPKKIVTMPGIEWELERKLAADDWKIVGLERDENIFDTVAGCSGFSRLTQNHLHNSGLGHLYLSDLESVPLTKVEDVSVIWADFSGPMTEARLTWLSSWWRTARSAAIVIITFTVGRTPGKLGADIMCAFPGGRPEHDLCYCDTQEMRQMAFARRQYMVSRRGQHSRARRITCSAAGCNRVALGAFGSHTSTLCRSHADNKEPERVYGRKLCSVEGCSREHRARGFCASHYERSRLSKTVPVSLIGSDSRQICPVCHDWFTPSHMGKYCSDSCARTAWTLKKNYNKKMKSLVTKSLDAAKEKVEQLTEMGLLKLPRTAAGLKAGRFAATKRGKIYLVRWILPD